MITPYIWDVTWTRHHREVHICIQYILPRQLSHTLVDDDPYMHGQRQHWWSACRADRKVMVVSGLPSR